MSTPVIGPIFCAHWIMRPGVHRPTTAAGDAKRGAPERKRSTALEAVAYWHRQYVLRCFDMDVEHWLNGISFRWDRRKAATNRRDHRVAFETACETFFDPVMRWTPAGQEVVSCSRSCPGGEGR